MPKEFIIKKDFDLNRAKINYQKELNDEQFKAVTSAEGPCLVLAGAGSGKTRTITYRVAYLLERGVSPDNILMLTFTNKAAREMIGRVETLLGSYPTGLWAGTFHSIANRILRQYASRIGYESNFSILDQEDSRDLIKVAIKDLRIDTRARRFPSPAVLQGIISYSRNAKKTILDSINKKHPNFVEIADEVRQVAEYYEKRKKQTNSMDFDDMLIKLLELLDNHRDIKEKLSNKFQYILVDEYQDTNIIQADIVLQLAAIHQNIFVVGDDAQSIYSFRAAEIKNILDFPKIFPETKTYRLEKNYRSTPEILEVANEVIINNTDQFKKELRPVLKSYEKPNLIPASSAKQEAEYIAGQILELRDEGVDLKGMAVLFRAAYHSQALEMELVKRDIPYEFRGGLKFFERAHIKDVISFLRAYHNPADEVSWFRTLGLQTGIGLSTAEKIIQCFRGEKDIKKIVNSDIEDKLGSRAKIGWRSMLLVLRDMVKANDAPCEMIRAIGMSDYRDYLENEYPNYHERLEDIEQLAIFSEQYDDLDKFLGEISLYDDYGVQRESKASNDEEKMVLSTIHQAKGLEWPVVFVINLVTGGFPNAKAAEEDGGMQEERRLFYVAVTRAQKHLYLSYPVIAAHEYLGINQPSNFLDEIPSKLLETIKLREEYSTKHHNNEPIIVLDDIGEVKSRPKPGSFLRDIDELL